MSEPQFKYELATDHETTFVLLSQKLTTSQIFQLSSMLTTAWKKVHDSRKLNNTTVGPYSTADVVNRALKKFETATGISGKIIPQPVIGTVWYNPPKFN